MAISARFSVERDTEMSWHPVDRLFLFFAPDSGRGPLTLTDPNMTRFMMTIDDAVDLVLYAFQNGDPGDIFVQKAPAATIGVGRGAAEAFDAKNEIRIIGTRHGEKLYETLLNREEMAKAVDMGDYFRVPADVRDLNYNCYFVEGQEEVSLKEDYNSHNTLRLDVDGMIKLLLKLDIIQRALKGKARKMVR